MRIVAGGAGGIDIMARVVCISYGLQVTAVSATANAIFLECIVVQNSGSSAAFIVTVIA
jgi:hypothetical protein